MDFASDGRIPRRWLLLFAALAFAATLLRAASQPFRFEELLALYVVRTGSLEKFWETLAGGAGPGAPLVFAVQWAMLGLAGEGHIVSRLPSMAGFAVLCWCVYRFAAFRLPSPIALSAALFTALSGIYASAWEAGGPALALGFCGLALSAWQRTAAKPLRWRALAAVSLSLAGALLSYWHAAILLAPLVVGEALRTARSRRVDPPAWIALAAPAAAILLLQPLVFASWGASGGNARSDAGLLTAAATYLDLFSGTAAPAFGVLTLVTAFHVSALARLRDRWADLRRRFPGHELAALALLLLAPLALSGSRTAALAVIPASILFSVALFLAIGASPRWPMAAPILLMGCFGYGFYHDEVAAATRPLLPADPAIQQWRTGTGQPLVIADAETFLQLDRYLPAAEASRLVFLTDRLEAARWRKAAAQEQLLRQARPWLPLRGRMLEFHQFVAGNPRFLLYGQADPQRQWLLRRVREGGAAVATRASPKTHVLAQVDLGAALQSRLEAPPRQ